MSQVPEDSSVYPDVLAQRYASARMRLIWSPEERVRSDNERRRARTEGGLQILKVPPARRRCCRSAARMSHCQ